MVGAPGRRAGRLLAPVGAVIGGVAGSGPAATLGALGVTDQEATEYQRRLHAGRYVLAVRDDGTHGGGAWSPPGPTTSRSILSAARTLP